MRKLLACLGLIGLIPSAQGFAYGSLPENPIAFSNCTAKVKVTAARLRSGPSLDHQIKGVRAQNEPLFVSKVFGKWVQVLLDDGDTAYVAAYLLSFPYAEMLEKWKKDSPSPTVGKKAKVKWASVNFRHLPSARGERLGRFAYGDEVAVLSKVGAWSLVEARARHGRASCYGFVSNAALAPPDVPDPAEWIAPLAQVRGTPESQPLNETPSQYLARTAWSPQVFAAEWKAQQRLHPTPAAGELLAIN